jgi:hypothetical protein
MTERELGSDKEDVGRSEITSVLWSSQMQFDGKQKPAPAKQIPALDGGVGGSV